MSEKFTFDLSKQKRGEKIKYFRKKRGMTQEELSELIGVKRSVISRYENGIIDPPFSQMQKIAAALDASFTELLGFDAALQGIDGIIQETAQHAQSAADAANAATIDSLRTAGEQMQSTASKTIAQMRLLQIQAAYDQLNDKGQETAVQRVTELTKIDDYRKPDSDEDWDIIEKGHEI